MDVGEWEGGSVGEAPAMKAWGCKFWPPAPQ